MAHGENITTQLRAVTLLRCVGWLEGISYLLLILVAMPLKYFAGLPEAVSIVGAIHGVAFIAFIIVVARVAVFPFWSIRESAFAMIASLLPAGTIIIDNRWKSMRTQIEASRDPNER